ncbi:hypothetical protein [Parafilimonas sp.]|uniref:hypothetical protein n=1 Tax=Parafilimonas sp. TaxID=1969739 RepID=UPI0039E2DF38
MTGIYDKLQLAVKYNMAPDDVKILVGYNCIIDTKNEKDKYALMMADIRLNESSAINMDDIRNATRVIYWRINDKDDSIAGLAWISGEAHSFSGKVLTP